MSNPNLQRRIQDIKDKGYTVASKRNGRSYQRKLLHLPRQLAYAYETISKELRARILDVLNGENAYELTTANQAGLIPDHKFPEIRWDAETPRNNPNDMGDDEIRAKFQLLNNPTEPCRNVKLAAFAFRPGNEASFSGLISFTLEVLNGMVTFLRQAQRRSRAVWGVVGMTSAHGGKP